MEDRTGIVIQENDVVLVVINNKSTLIVVRGGATKQGMLRGININFDSINSLKSITFKPSHSIILSKIQIVSLTNKQIENLNERLDTHLEIRSFSKDTKELLRQSFAQRVELVEIIQRALRRDIVVRDCIASLEFVIKKKNKKPKLER